MDCVWKMKECLDTITNQLFSERSGHSVWVHLSVWFCLCTIHGHNVTVSLGNSPQIHWLQSSQGNAQYFTSTKQFSACVGKPYDYHGEQYWHTLPSSLKETLKRTRCEKKTTASPFLSITKLPNSILMFGHHRTKSNANVPISHAPPPLHFPIFPVVDSFTALHNLPDQSEGSIDRHKEKFSGTIDSLFRFP